jgi:hypothetical protein
MKMKRVAWGIAVVFLVTLLVAKPLPIKGNSGNNAKVSGGAGFLAMPDVRAFHDRIGRLLEDEFSRFDNLFSPPSLPQVANTQTFTFSTDVYEEGNYIVIKCDLPGMDKKNIKG